MDAQLDAPRQGVPNYAGDSTDHFRAPAEATEPGAEGPSVRRVLAAIASHKWLVIGLAAGGLVLAFVYLRLVSPVYTASALVVPVASQESPLARYAQFSSLAGSNIGSSGAVTNYDRYREILKSVVLAERLEAQHSMLPKVFPGEWNAAEQQWQPPSGIVSTLRRAIREIAGLPAWAPPSAKRLAEYLDRNIKVRDLNVSPVVSISMSHKDPAFAVRFLQLALVEADELIRQKEREQVSENVAYVRAKLSEIAVQEYRRALVEVLSNLEQRAMLAESEAAFAAEILDPPTVSELPTKPNPEMTLALFLVVSSVIGIAGAMFIENRKSGRSGP